MSFAKTFLDNTSFIAPSFQIALDIRWKNFQTAQNLSWAMVAFKQPNSLRNLLVRAEISKPNTTSFLTKIYISILNIYIHICNVYYGYPPCL
jgi:hypothetical protein